MTSAFKMTKCIREKNLSYISIYIIQLCRTIILQVFELVAVDRQRHTQRGGAIGAQPPCIRKIYEFQGVFRLQWVLEFPLERKKISRKNYEEAPADTILSGNRSESSPPPEHRTPSGLNQFLNVSCLNVLKTQLIKKYVS